MLKPREYAQKALNLDPGSSEAHLVIGLLSQILGGNERKTIKHLRQALSINPGDTHAIAWLGVSLCNVGKTEDARALWENMRQMDPLMPMSRAVLGLIDIYEWRIDSAINLFSEWFRLESQNPAALYYYTLALAYAGRSKEASEIIDQHVHIDWPDTFTKLSLLVKYAIEKDTQKIEKLVSGDFEKTLRNDSQSTYFASALFTYAGMKDKALDFLEQAVKQGFINYPLMSEKDPILEKLREEERFKKLMERVKYEWEHFDD